MNKRGALVFALILPSFLLYAQSAQKETANWVLGASAFTVEKTLSKFETEGLDREYKAAQLLPKLILEKAGEAGMRTVSAEELYLREKQVILVQRRRLYADLEKKTDQRDKLIAIDADEKKLRLEIGAKEKAIQTLISELEKNKEKENALSPAAFTPVKEKIVLWKQTAGELYPALRNSVFSAQPSDIQGLISGSINGIGDYIQAEVQLILYPASSGVLRMRETERFDKLDLLANRLAEKIILVLRNGKEVRLIFDIQPADAVEKASIRLDGRLLRAGRDLFACPASAESAHTEGKFSRPLFSVLAADGIHELYVEAEGFIGSSFVYNFSDSEDFYVQVRLQRQQEFPLKIKSVGEGHCKLFFNGLAAFPSDTESNTFAVNGFPVLVELSDRNKVRHFVLENGSRNKVQVPEYVLSADLLTCSVSIEKKRKIMYNSYAALILSLPVSFLLLGKQVDEYNSWARGNNISDDLQSWKIAAYTASGISIGLGINFLVQLGIYLHSVNTILPGQVKPAKR